MNISTIVRGVLVSLLLAAIAVIIDRESLTAPLAAGNLALLSEIAVAIFVGILLMRVTENIKLSSSPREQGTVKWFNIKKGYGFITRDQGEDIFVHFRNIKDSNRRSMVEGQRVEFVIITSDKGLQADEVTSVS